MGDIFNFPFSLFKKFKIKRKFAYWLPLEFLLMGKPFTIDAYFKGKNVQYWDDAYFKRKMCRIGRLMLNPLS
jgi:hypothetical protein